MADKDPATAAAEAAAKKLVEVAYGDLLQPATQEIGAELQQFVKTIIVAGRGFGYLIRETYHPFVVTVLNKIPSENRIVPDPQILGNVLEGITYQPAESEVSRMFEDLLNCTMDKTLAGLAHPAFPTFINRMSRDDAVILSHARTGSLRIHFHGDRRGKAHNCFPEIGHTLLNKDNSSLYFDNLSSLGLLKEDATGRARANGTGGFFAVSPVRLTTLGGRFMDACMRSAKPLSS